MPHSLTDSLQRREALQNRRQDCAADRPHGRSKDKWSANRTAPIGTRSTPSSTK